MTKGGKKRKQEMVGEKRFAEPCGKDPNVLLVTDTDYHTGGNFSSPFHEIYEKFQMGNFPIDQEEREVWENMRRISFFLIEARPTILPYTDMISWVLAHTTDAGQVVNDSDVVIASFKPTNLARIYKLPNPEVVLDKEFMDAFIVAHSDYDKFIKEWWYDEEAFKPKSTWLYSIHHFQAPYRCVVAMIY